MQGCRHICHHICSWHRHKGRECIERLMLKLTQQCANSICKYIYPCFKTFTQDWRTICMFSCRPVISVTTQALWVTDIRTLDIYFLSTTFNVFVFLCVNVLAFVFVFQLVMPCLLTLLINRQTGHICLQQFCMALKTLKSKVNSVFEWLTDKVT